MRQHLYWIRTNPVPRAGKVDFMNALEHACWFTKETRSGATFNYQLGQHSNYVMAPIPGGKQHIHPAQKPVDVLTSWIRIVVMKGAPGEILNPSMVRDLIRKRQRLVYSLRLKLQLLGQILSAQLRNS